MKKPIKHNFKFEHQITIVYLIIGLSWILLSDTLTDSLIANKHLLKVANISKGFIYVLITASLLFYFVKRQLHKLQKAKELAEKSDRLKSAFLSNISHEIRTPMNGILGFSSLLKEPNLSGKKQQEYIEMIEKSGNRMMNIINDIVDISKIESGVIHITKKETNLNEMISNIYDRFSPEAASKGLIFMNSNKLSTTDAVIKTDNEKVNAILKNLVKNAIKYTREGVVEVGCERKGKHLEFFVKDTGIGIPKDRQEAIFERFVQADIEDKMAWQGAGLGLAITKAYVELLGGKIWLESEEGKGSTFYFNLPIHL